MATRYAVATGNWSNAATWDGGASVPSPGDTVRANGFTVTIDTNLTGTAYNLRTDASAPAAAGGNFTVSTTRTLNVNCTGGTTSCLLLAGTSDKTVTIVGNANGSANTSANSCYGISVTGANAVVLTGNIAGGVGSGGNQNHGMGVSASATITITGDITGGSGGCAGLSVQSGTVSVSVTGNVVGGSTSSGAATSNPGINHAGSGLITVTGNVTAGSGTAGGYGVYITSTGSVKIVGTCTSNNDSSAVVAINSVSSVVRTCGNLVTGGTGRFAVVALDRKSTRLNSSHRL